MRLSELAGKKVAVIGAGREGGSVIKAVRSRSAGAVIHVLNDNATDGQQFEGCPVLPIDAEQLDWADVIVKSPGVSRYRDELRGRENITSATNLWFAEPHAPVIAVTGTKGKSTTSSLTAHLLNALGLKARIAGNIGQNPLDLIDEPEPDWWVLELSSFQTSDLQAQPDVAAMTSFSPEHLDWHGDAETYFRDKTRLLGLAKKQVINPISDEMRALLQTFPDATQPDADWTPPPSQLSGRHNQQLIRLVYAILQAAGIDTDANKHQLAQALLTFEPLPHRLQPAGEVNGVLYINDSLGTTPIATQAAIEAFEGRPRTVLVGGYDRGISYDKFGEFMRTQTGVKLITLPDCGDRIAAAVNQPSIITHSDGLEEAVKIAAATTPAGGVVLLSPGAASFGHFKDYAERGQKFVEFVQKLSSNA